jgi:hypothetical protein
VSYFFNAFSQSSVPSNEKRLVSTTLRSDYLWTRANILCLWFHQRLR